jgi:hypothetical protein
VDGAGRRVAAFCLKIIEPTAPKKRRREDTINKVNNDSINNEHDCFEANKEGNKDNCAKQVVFEKFHQWYILN